MTIAGLALTAGATVANYSAQTQITAARNDALAAERIRQNTLNHEADAVNLAARDQYKDFGTDQAERSVALGDFLKGQTVAEPAPVAAMPISSSDIVTREENQQRTDARDFTNQQGDALGQLRAFGDVLADDSLTQARDASQVAQIGGFKTGSAGVVPYELDKAGHAGDGAHFIGDLLAGLGTVATGAGLSGGSLPVFKTPGLTAAANVPVGNVTASLVKSPVRLGSLFG